ncbi:DUF3427 domain-containing protein [Crenobacter intestini]|uniref:DUF3427 domain-containing protein n=1 Tax=Crenobacter intestini TaxID=2563443 RepID=UPI001457F0B6|nr:DUF3427 domain-containing protein [Crenobacter intestini]
MTVLENFSLEHAAQYGYSDSTDYDLLHNSQRYPPKAVLGLAVGQLLGQPLSSNSFTGGLRSPCFSILQGLGFQIVPKPVLQRYQRYSRHDISQLFEPGCIFTPGAGRWGISGIVDSPKGSGHFVFLVTLGEPTEGNPYQDSITEDGYLIWESQNRHDFHSSVIQQLLQHDPNQRNIHLFLRGNRTDRYAYMGVLAYHQHDPQLVRPVHFIWQIQNWDLSTNQLHEMGLPYRPALNPLYCPPIMLPPTLQLQRVEPPVATPVAIRGKSKRSQANVIDWAARDERNRGLGLCGELLVLQYEIDRLTQQGCNDLAQQVQHVALHNAAAGYDIASYHPDGRPKLIEVKSTQGPADTAFYISANEINAAKEQPDAYVIYRVYGLHFQASSVQFFELPGAVEQHCQLEAVSFRAQVGRGTAALG